MSDTTYDAVRVERDGNAATVTLARPDHLNSFTQGTTEELRDAVTELTGDDAVRCIVLACAGDAFSAGADLGRLDGVRAGRAGRSGTPRPTSNYNDRKP